MSTTCIPAPGWVIEIEGRHGSAPTQTQTLEIIEVLGIAGHRHYRVRWDDGHESIFFPSDDARIRPAHG